MENAKEIEINGISYMPKSILTTIERSAKTFKGKKYVIARTYSAGVFAGYLDKREGKEVTLLNARRIWYWDGATSLSQLAMSGTTKPENCKFAIPVSKVLFTELIELLDVTEKARLNIQGVKVWQ